MRLLAQILLPCHMFFWVRRFSINRENVYIQAEPVIFSTLFGDSRRIVYFCKKVHKIRLGIMRTIQTLVSPPLILGYKAFKIGPGHQNIDIIVPRNETLVADCSYQSAVCQGITYALLAAKRIHIFQNVGKRLLYFGM